VSHPFGHGLSYTRFEYADLRVATSGAAGDGSLAVDVTCRVTNAGERRGKEVVQLYAGDDESSVARPPRELRGFVKLDLEPGETREAAFRLGARDLSFWSAGDADWVLEPGAFTIAVGASSRDLRLTAKLEIEGPRPRVALDDRASLAEWLGDPDGAARLRAALGTDDSGRLRGALGNEELVPLIGNFPLRRLAAFPGFGIDHAMVDELVRRG
jgi:beta-glucosidase